MSAHPLYRSYLLKVWRLSTATGPAWRIVLQDVVSQHQLTFTSLGAAAAFLEQQLEYDLDDPKRVPASGEPDAPGA